MSWLITWNKKEKENIAIIATSLPYLLVTISSISVWHVHVESFTYEINKSWEVGFELEAVPTTENKRCRLYFCLPSLWLW